MATRSSRRTTRSRSTTRLGAALGAAALPAVLLLAACSGTNSQASSSGAGGSGGHGGGATTTTTTTTTSSTGGSGGQGAGGAEPTGCVADADCTDDPTKPICDTNTGECVGCLVANDACAVGQYCNPVTDQCEPGCSDNTDCNAGAGLICNPQNHKCVGCVIDNDCGPGTICISSTCVLGCTPNHACQIGSSCCGSSCFDLSTNVDHCGSCSNPCTKLDNAATICSNSMCALGACDAAYADCDGQADNGCEWNILQDGPCACVPHATQSCYQGTPGTKDVGPCHAGTQTCDDDGTGWGPCLDQFLPVSEVCANGTDDDCDGNVDNGSDLDGDGWTSCQGDCCDTPGPGCASPNLVNPGAFEVVNNGLDDDCNPATLDDTPLVCNSAQKFANVTGVDIAQAMDICQTTTANPILPQNKTWGLISATQLLADGSVPASASNIQNWQSAVLTTFGSAVTPKVGATMAGISTGRMRGRKDAGWVSPDGGTSFGQLGQPPAAYLAAHANALPASAGCNGSCASGSGANDSVNIKLTIRVPTNAQSFSYQFKFYSAEFPEYQCTQFNDFYLALLSSTAQGIPADKNISFDGLGNVFSVNNGFFDVCAPAGCNTCPDGVSELACTGMEGAVLPCAGAVGAAGIGGGSKWLTTDAPITPGEVITLELMVFDVGDSSWDSLALLDNFHWALTPAAVSTHQ